MGTFVPNPTFDDAVLRGAKVKRVLEDLVEEGAKIASELAPDDPATGPDEDLHGSIVGEVALGEGGFRGRITARNYKGLFYEAGTALSGPRPFLRPALDRLGLEVDPDEGTDR